MKKRWIFLFSYILLGCGDSNSQFKDNQREIVSVEHSTPEELLKAINEARSIPRVCSEGSDVVGPSPKLRWNKNLYISAYEHSRDMAFSDTFSHDGSGSSYDITGSLERKRSLFSERIHRHIDDKEAVTGENIAGGIFFVDEVVKAWLKSPKHCENIMNEAFTDMGISIVVNQNSRFQIYWTQDFSRRD